MNNDDLISRSALKKDLLDRSFFPVIVKNAIENAPAVDAVYRGVMEQVMWERNTAFMQLEEHGIPFGGTAPDVVKVVRCKDCKHSKLEFFADNGTTRIETYKCLHHRMGINVLEHDDFCSYGERRVDDATD